MKKVAWKMMFVLLTLGALVLASGAPESLPW
jgi:hypothetical protein